LKAALDELALCNLSIMVVIELGEDLLSAINCDVEVKTLKKCFSASIAVSGARLLWFLFTCKWLMIK